MAIKLGNSGNNTLNGTNGSDLIYGGGGDDVVNGGGGIDILFGGADNDTMNGGSGSDLVSGDTGNDTLIYKMSENSGAIDIYDGGSGSDTLRLELTSAEWANAAVKADVAAFLADSDHLMLWKSSGLVTHDFEHLTLVVDGAVTDPNPPPPNNAPDAVDDNPLDTVQVGADPSATGNVLANDSDPDGDVPLVFSFASTTQTGVPGDTIEGVYGDLVMYADGTWNYVLDEADPDTAALANQTLVSDAFSYTISDGHGLFDTATLTILVLGPQSGPVGDV